MERVIGRLKTRAAFAATRRPQQAKWDRQEVLVAQMLTNFSLDYTKPPKAHKVSDVRIEPVSELPVGELLYGGEESDSNSEDEDGLMDEEIRTGLWYDEETGEERLYLPRDIPNDSY